MQTESNSRIVRESVIARSPQGRPVMTFDTPERASQYFDRNPNFTVQLFKQTITETEIIRE